MNTILNNDKSSSGYKSKELKILGVAGNIFLKYGYHGTTLNLVAKDAGVSKSNIHYYYRSKDNLYRKVMETVIDLLVRTSFEISSGSKGFGRIRWFLITEQYNNKVVFEKTMKEIFPSDFERKLEFINQWLNSPSNIKDYI